MSSLIGEISIRAVGFELESVTEGLLKLMSVCREGGGGGGRGRLKYSLVLLPQIGLTNERSEQ